MNKKTKFRELIENTDKFLVAVELETTRGLTMDVKGEAVKLLANRLGELEQVDLFCLTDNPGGNPHIRPEILGQDLLSMGTEVVVNVSCKDYNRNGIESRLWALGSTGFENILALSGDYPVSGFYGQSQPVFDIDSVGLLEMMKRMNEGVSKEPIRGFESIGTNFYPGCAVNPFKLLEGELITQYLKLEMKVKTGAKWAVSQIGYDARKLDELLKFTKENKFELPLIGSIFILNAPAASFFNRWGIPGVAVSDSLLSMVKKQADSSDRGRSFFSEFAAKQIAILRGLGYRGVYMSGRPKFERLRDILKIEASFAADDWKQFASEINFSQPEEFYFYEESVIPGLSSTNIDAPYIKSQASFARRKSRLKLPISFLVGKFLHDRLFDSKSKAFFLGSFFYRFIEKFSKFGKFLHLMEQGVKVSIYNCQDCGDCSLPDVAYLCPESQCVKNQRNGPCGGTKAGKCEILDKQCIWVRAYDRLKPYGLERNMLKHPVIFKDASLQGTSAWGNTFMKRDHHAEIKNDDLDD